MSQNEIKMSLNNFKNSLLKLQEFLTEPVVNDRDKAGIIQAFEYTFEIAWKTIQKMAGLHNKNVGSARQAFQAAFELGWLKAEVDSTGEDSWKVMADDRNLTSYTYKEDIANAVLTRIREQHYDRLTALHERLGKEINL